MFARFAARNFSSGPRVIKYTGKNVNVTAHIDQEKSQVDSQ
jgi:hypothetical protein